MTPCNTKQQVGVRAHDERTILTYFWDGSASSLGTVTGEGHESCQLLTWQGDNLMVCGKRRPDAFNAVPFPGPSGHLALVLHWPTPWNSSHSGLGQTQYDLRSLQSADSILRGP